MVRDPDAATAGRAILFRCNRIGTRQLRGLPHHDTAQRRPNLRCVHRRLRPGRRGAPCRRACRWRPAWTFRRLPSHARSSPCRPSRCRSRFPTVRPGGSRSGVIAGARSGDKGGSANVGRLGAHRSRVALARNALTVDKLRELLPETADLTVNRHLLPHLRARQLRHRGDLGKGCGLSGAVRPAGQGNR